ncbi:MAG TPA: tail fiber protein [Candidatus Limnocylindria bacterium]|jgi:microcystin-dependent protein|nr:tail fiber protein [Candidatus Limnocylindria bacterium]
MANPFVAEIRIFPFNFAPVGWALCNGQLLPISQNTALFSLVGVYYGGNGTSTFGLPNLQGAVPIHTTQYGTSPLGTFSLGQSGGETSVILLTNELPLHTHTVEADYDHRNAVATNPNGAVQVFSTGNLVFSTTGSVTMNPSMVGVMGTGAGHNNLMPYLVMNYCIAMQGVFPARS